MEANIYNITGEKIGKMNLPENIFNTKINVSLMHEVVKWYLANCRQGTHAAKTRAEVSGSGKKPWRQKGTGRARAGSIRSPLWRHGGVIFAKKPREFSYSIPKKKVRIALLSSLSAKAKEGNVIILDDIKVEQPKTKEMSAIIKKLKIENKILLVCKKDEKLSRASRNISTLNVCDIPGLTTYNVLDADKVIFTKESLDRCSALSI
ncbi:MAG: 50S ribosomal protein L4 [Elusimicrobia bacterium]|nr:50S ribosomal protein L4 [Elusimicrobiota bacterium]